MIDYNANMVSDIPLPIVQALPRSVVYYLRVVDAKKRRMTKKAKSFPEKC